MAETEMKLDQSLDDIIAGNNAAAAAPPRGGGDASAATCYGCGGTGHFKRDCPSAPARGGGGGGRGPYGYGGGDGGAPGGGGGEQEVIRVARRVYVSNLTYRLSWQELKDFAREAGNVVHAKVMESGGRSKGCGIVEYSTAEEAAQAILTLHDRMLGGRPVCVREDREDRDLRGALEGEGGGGRVGGGGGYRGVSVRSRSRSPPRGDRYARADRPPPVRTEASPCTLYVGNLAYTSTWQSLKDHAASLGIAGVARAEVPANAGGRSRGFGLITFETPSEAEAAVAQLNETELDGRRLLVRLDRGSVRT